MKLIIPYKIESLNVVNKKHWSYKHRAKKAIMEMLLIGKRYAKPFYSEVKITSRRRRLLDEHDNLRGGTCKQVVDALVTMGWIKGDAVKDCKIIIEQIKSKEDDTVIELC